MFTWQDLGSWFFEEDGYKDVLRYASIPIVAALIGYCTNVLAIQMTFLPLEYFGFGEAFFHKWGFSLGWQVHCMRTTARHAAHGCIARTRSAAGPALALLSLSAGGVWPRPRWQPL